MANEITSTFGLVVSGGPSLAAANLQSLSDWVATQGALDFVKSVGTTETTVEATGISVNGTVHLWNQDATNYVEWGFSTGVYGGKLRPGRHAQFDLNSGAAIYVKANTAACRVRVVHVGGV